VSVRLQETPKAQEDLDQIEDFLMERSPDAARMVIQAVSKTYQGLIAWPEKGSPLFYKKVRMFPVRGFPQFLVLYCFDSEESLITVIRVIRGAQDWTRILMDEED
jgi:toxin ParE1/3/4